MFLYGFDNWCDLEERTYYVPTPADWAEMAADLAAIDALEAESALHSESRFGVSCEVDQPEGEAA